MKACVDDPTQKCTPAQFQDFLGYADQFMQALDLSMADSKYAHTQNGGLITNCDMHDHLIHNYWNEITVQGRTMRAIISEWLRADKPLSKWTVDRTQWPENKTCKGPL